MRIHRHDLVEQERRKKEAIERQKRTRAELKALMLLKRDLPKEYEWNSYEKYLINTKRIEEQRDQLKVLLGKIGKGVSAIPQESIKIESSKEAVHSPHFRMKIIHSRTDEEPLETSLRRVTVTKAPIKVKTVVGTTETVTLLPSRAVTTEVFPMAVANDGKVIFPVAVAKDGKVVVKDPAAKKAPEKPKVKPAI